MNIDGLEKINLGELNKLFKIHKLGIKDALPHMREFRDKHALSDKQAINAFNVAKRIFDK